MGEMNIGTCQVCGKENVPLNRKYYHYGIKCECCSPEHFEMVEHCKDCIPKPPKKIKVSLRPKEEID